MEPKPIREPRSPWRSAVKGGLIAGVVPIVLWFVLSLTMGETAQEGIGWIFVAGILAFPVVFALGAVGGLLGHMARGRMAIVPVEAQPTRWARVAWLAAGALAGYDASRLTAFRWPMIGGVLIGIALIPVWIFVGASVGQRVAAARGPGRPIWGSAIVGGAVHEIVSSLIDLPPIPLGPLRPAVVTGVAAVIASVFAYRRLLNAQ